MDTYLTCNRWWQFPRGGTFLDLGCGFPPLTAIETAQKLPDWRVIGADPVIPHFIVYDERGDYTNFNEAGDILYFQGDGPRFGAFTQDPAGTKAYFSQLFGTLRAKQTVTGGNAVQPPELNGARLVTNPIGAYETPNLSFQTAGIGAVDRWAFHNDEVEMNRQAMLVEQIRADTTFRRDFDSRLDALLADHRLFNRGTDGYLTSWGSEMPADKNVRLAQINEQLDQEGYVEAAVNVLRQTGYQAWRNCVGHIGVDPAQLAV